MVEKKDKKKPSKKRVKKQVENKNVKKQTQNKKGMKQSQTVIVNLGKKSGKSSNAPRTAPTPKPPIIINPTISIPYYVPQMEKVLPENIKIEAPVAVKENTVAPVKEKKPKREVAVAVPIEEDAVSNDKPVYAGNAVNAPRRGRPPNTDIQNAIAKERRNELARQRRAVEKQRMISEVIQMEGQDVNVLEPTPVLPDSPITIPRRSRTKKIIIRED